jgi:tetratricopeptide (TPR) repeat protein
MYAYNPRKKPSQELEKSLVGKDRWDVLNNILQELTIGDGEGPKQHWMIVGPRGIGKSHLMTLLYHKINENRKLSKLWIPILFPENLRMAGNLTRFLERAVNEILIEFDQEKNPISHEMKQKIQKIRKVPLQERADYLFSILSWVHRKAGKHILLITENLQQLLGKKIIPIEQKKLRAFLQTSDAVLIIGSATTIFDALHDHSHPFYHFFHIRRLEDLSFDDMKTLIISLLSESELPELIKEVEDKDARLKTLYSFTGGNPRMAVFLSDIIKTEVPDEMLELMDNILDQLTPYFEAILNDIPDYLEEIINTLAAFEPAQSPREIAGHLETPQATIRNYLKQLKEAGYVRIAFSKGKSNYYCLNEYLYRTWYQMRDSGHREETRWLMELLLMLYSPDFIIEEKNKAGVVDDVEQTAYPYKKFIAQAAGFIESNPDYCKVIESCVDSMITDEKKDIKSRKDEELFKTAINYFKRNQYEKAIRICKNILKVTPKAEEAYSLWGDCLREQGRYKGAIEKIIKAIEINPKAGVAYWVWGAILRKQGRYEEAIEKFKQAIKIDSKSYASYGAMGDCLKYLSRYDEAEKQYKKAIEINDKYKDAYRAWGHCLQLQEHYKDAIKKFKKATDINPKSDNSYELWGYCLLNLNRYEEAIDKFKQTIKINPKSESGYGLWGNCLRKLERYEEAIEKFKKAIELNPKSEQAYWFMGACLREQQRYKEAIDKFKEVIKIDSKSFASYGAIGDCFRELSLYDEAEKKYKKAIEINDKYEDAYAAWGYCLFKRECYEDAIEKFKQAIEINPAAKNNYWFWGTCLQELERYEEAIIILEKHLPKSKDSHVIYSYGNCLMGAKHYSEALKQFERLINIQPEYYQVYLPYGQLLENKQDKELALLAYLKHISFGSMALSGNFDFQKIHNEHILPLLKALKPGKYIKQFYATDNDRKFSEPTLSIFLVLLGKYDAVSENIKDIVKTYLEKEDEERSDFNLFIFTIKLSIWLKLCEGDIHNALRLVDLYIEYIKALQTTKQKEDEVSKFSLGLFRIQINLNINADNVLKVLKCLEDEDGVPFNDIFLKVWTCLNEPDSVESQRYLNEKAIAEVVKELKKKTSSDYLIRDVSFDG